MSGLEPLAVVSAVAGILQAYEAGSKIFRQIKARRQAHGALPPTDRLLESLEKGESEVKKAVEEGKLRFGEDFEIGDTATLFALMQITIDVQKALLAGLAEARSDDGVVDFEMCINSCDKARQDALITLQGLFLRRLAAEQKKADNPTSPPEQAKRSQGQSPPVPERTSENMETQRSPPPRLEKRPTDTESTKAQKAGRWLLSRRDRSGESSVTLMESTPVMGSPPAPPARASEPDTMLQSRRSTSTSTNSITTRSSTSTHEGAPPSPARSSTNSSSIAPVRRHTTGYSMHSMSGLSAVAGLSMTSDISTPSTVASLKKSGRCCKKTSELRDGKISEALAHSHAPGSQARTYHCTNKKCHFWAPAVQVANVYQLDNSVICHPSGMRYRRIFLAKCHMQQSDATQTVNYRCLVCLFLGDSRAYEGHDQLLSHLASHRGVELGETRLEGPVIFTNKRVECNRDEFDIDFTEPAKEPIRKPYTVTEAMVVPVSRPQAQLQRSASVVSDSPNFALEERILWAAN
ncbi:hypothetical protein G647_09180 [Cladophialophora carrionii CBS 160.54]|uniref:Uncharacterized protein n=1 Tax=Cladophialophora carrionii CBS 160.54 TaxID=1279043 RepID=V9CZ86_9EURO|nr:uncharacterized protein G647_09180 [Cladophialophora carrionii CBS 160.54]ETI19348.1 hypothetical protein G647_09180 [Cladophialophora carrionii CBS 160.54]